MKTLSPLFYTCMLFLCMQVMCTQGVLAYTHEVRQSGSSYIWRVNNADQGSTSNLAQAIMNAMGSNREIHILASGTITQTINVSASGVRLHFHNNTLTGNFSGSGIINNGHSGFEIYDLILRNISNGYGIRCSAASNLRFVNVRVIDIGWIGMRIDSRTSNPWNYTVSNLYMKDCRFENCGSHGLETYSIDGITLEGTMTARNCGECGVLLNQTRNGTIANVDSYNCNWGGGYAGLRYANACSNITTNYLKADRCGRGFFIVQSGPSVNCHLNNAEIYQCSGLGIWIENGTNCSVKAGCSQSPVSVSGSGSYANVSNNCSGGGGGGTTYYRIQNRGTGLFLDGMGRTVNGEACGQYANTTHVNAQWERISVGSYYQFKNRGTGLFLDGMGRTANGSDVGQWANSSHNNSHWSVQQYSGNYYRIQNRATGLFLDGMGRTENGSALGQYANTTHVNAQWQLIAVSSSARMAFEEQTITTEESKLVRVHPNPSSDEITIELPSSYDGEKIADLHDGMGKVAVSNKFNSTQHTMHIGNLPAGLYILKIRNNQKLIVEKVIKR